ncbi:MAG: hypothetical protein QXG00_04175 [Candidatus Woesearchaeota archaeon]
MSIIKRILENKRLLRQFKKLQEERKKQQQQNFVVEKFDSSNKKKKKQLQQLDLFENVDESKMNKKKSNQSAIVKVKSHLKKTKKGKLSLVREHQRKKINGAIKKFKVIKQSYIDKVKNSSPKDREKLLQNLKVDIVKMLAKDFGVKDKNKLKSKANILYTNVVKNLQNNVDKKNVKLKEEDSSKSKKSKFAFGFFASGEDISTITNNPSKLLYEGYTFYNQDISKDKNWGQTLKRKDLKILRLGKQDISSDKAFDVYLMSNVNGKIKTKFIPKMKVEKIIKIIQRGV